MSQINFSVIICYHNAETTLGRLIESLARSAFLIRDKETYPSQTVQVDSLQSFCPPHSQLVFVDNASTDESRKIAEDNVTATNLSDYFKVLFVTEPLKGVSAARNRGLAESTGQYIAFVDADDEVGLDYFPVILQALSTTPDCVYLDLAPAAISRPPIRCTREDFTAEYLAGWWNWAFIFRKRLADGRQFTGDCFEDFGFFPLVVGRAKVMIVLGGDLYQYHQGKGGLTAADIHWRLRQLMDQYRRLQAEAEELPIDLWQRVERGYFNHLMVLRSIAAIFPVLSFDEMLRYLRLYHFSQLIMTALKILLRRNLSALRGFLGGRHVKTRPYT